MYYISHKTTYMSRDFAKTTPLGVDFAKKFARQFIPVFYRAKTKDGFCVTEMPFFNLTCSDDGTSKLDATSPSLFLNSFTRPLKTKEYLVKKFVSQFIPVFCGAKMKDGFFVTAKPSFPQLRSEMLSPIWTYHHPSIFFQSFKDALKTKGNLFKSFVSQFRPVLRDANTKSRVTSTRFFTSTRKYSDDITSKWDNITPSIFLQVNNNNLTLMA